MTISFDMRLVGYTPLAGRIGPIPDLGISVTTAASGPILNATISTAVYGTLPVNLEVAVEYWHSDTQLWTEPRDCRFAVSQQAYDDRDATGTTTLTGVGIGAFLMAANSLAGVEPYVNTTGTSEVAAVNNSLSVSGDTFTWPSHVFGNGDRIHITSKGSAKNLKAGTYFVRAPTTNTFKISTTPLGTAKTNMGSASNLKAQRVVTRIVFSGSHSFVRSSQVCVTGGTALGLSDGTAYYVVNPTAATIQLSNHPNGVPITLNAASTNVTQVYRNLDGQRIFNNAHPGTILSSAFLEARNRGWAVGASDQLSHGWTTTQDSANNAWTSMADDPTTPGISVGFQPGTPMTSILQFMLDNQYAEWYMTGRTIQVVNYGTGTDHTIGSTPKRIGTEASQLPVTIDLTNMRNSVIVRGTGSILREKDNTPGAWGRLETYVTASGITTKTSADKQGSTDLAANGTPQIGYSLTEMAGEAHWLPGVHFSRGDWVAVQLAGTGWTRLRVIGWTLAKAANGTITVTNVLQYQKKHIVAKAIKATAGASAGISDSGTSTSPILDTDNRKPSMPIITGVTLAGGFATDDSAICTATVNWNPVSADINGGDIISTEYQLWVRAEGADNGTIVGETSAFQMDINALPSGQTFAASVRAMSDQGEWGEFSDEYEFLTTYVVDVPLVPTAPTVTGHLGQARVAWDGNLLDPSTGSTIAASDASQAGFAYVYVSYATTSSGPFTQIGTNMGNAGAVAISALSIANTYWFVLTTVNTLGVASAISTPVPYTIVGVTGPDLVANSVTANTIAAGAITADKLDIGTVPSGSPVDRVPMPLTNMAYWNLTMSGAMNLQTGYVQYVGAAATSTGILLSPTSTSSAYVYLTGPLPDVASGKLYLSGLSTGSNASFAVTEYPSLTSNAGAGTTIAALLPTGHTHLLAASTVRYAVQIYIAAGVPAETVASAHIFEILGNGGTGQAAEISPSGLRLFDTNGNLAVDLTTATKQYFNIYDSTAVEPVSVASIDQGGNATFTSVSSGNGGVDVNGSDLTIINQSDPQYNTTLDQSSPNGSSWTRVNILDSNGSPTPVPLLDRLSRGVIYDVTWPSQDGGSVVPAQYLRRIAQDQFTLEDGRMYEFNIQLAGLQADNTTAGDTQNATQVTLGANAYVEFQLGITPNTSVTSGDTVSRSVIYNNMRGYWSMPPVVWASSVNQSSIDHINRVLPAGVPIYWQLNFNIANTMSRSVHLSEFGGSRGLTVIDLGSAYVTRPVSGADNLVDVHDYSYTGSSSGSSSGGTTSSSKTVTGTASWSATYNQSGGNKVTGTGQYTNGSAMYQGNGSSPMGSQFGFSSSFLSQFAGKTITAVQLYLKNTYMGYPGHSAILSTHSATSASSTIGNGRGSNPWSKGYSSGQGQWINVPSGVLSGLSSGSVKGFQLGVDGSNSNYGYFAGANQSNPPKLRVTYH